jgi:hypothetical protein
MLQFSDRAWTQCSRREPVEVAEIRVQPNEQHEAQHGPLRGRGFSSAVAEPNPDHCREVGHEEERPAPLIPARKGEQGGRSDRAHCERRVQRVRVPVARVKEVDASLGTSSAAGGGARLLVLVGERGREMITSRLNPAVWTYPKLMRQSSDTASLGPELATR